VEYVAASPSLKIVDRSGTLSTAVQDIRSGKAISAIYIPPDFERDLKAERRPQVVGFYNQQFLTPSGIASSGLNDALSAAAAAAAPAKRAAPAAASIGTLTSETIALVNPQKNYAQFLLRALLPTIIHVVITLAAGYSVGSEFRRRDARAWLESAGGDPVVALVGKLAPLFGIFFLIMLAEPLFLEGVLQIPFRGDLPLMVAAASLLIVAHLSLGALLQLLAGDLASGLARVHLRPMDQREREKQARVILGSAEEEVAQKFVNAAKLYAQSPEALQLRAMNIIYETTKERGATILMPTSMVDAMNPGAAAFALNMAKTDAGGSPPAPAPGTSVPSTGSRS